MGNNASDMNRRELYEKVWETPITQLAQKYGLSDVGFAKICKKYNIPRPPRGYWARKASGQQPEKEPLPNMSSDEIIPLNPNPPDIQTPENDSDFSRLIELEKNSPPIVVQESLRNPHPLIKESAEILETCKPDEIGILRTRKAACLDIHVSQKTLRRALRIMNALINGLLERGFEVVKEDDGIWTRIYGENVGFGISEEIVAIHNKPKNISLEGSYSFGHSSYDYVREPSGTLCLTIKYEGYFGHESLRKKWRDTERKQLEDCLNSVITGLVKMALYKKEKRLQEEEQERQRQEKERRRKEQERRVAELKRKIREEQERVERLIADAENFYRSKCIRDFIAAVENERQKNNQIYVSNEDFDAWSKWAREQADRLDPLVPNPPSILDENIEPDVEQVDDEDEFDEFEES
jgi:hypothetical protein